jgi:uncharacterized glyoxalase superfamily protein PhnB
VAQVKFLDAVPTLASTSVKDSLRFYVEGLGFEVEWVWPFDRMEKDQACIRRGAVRLFITRQSQDGSASSAAKSPITCAIFVDEIELLFEQLQHRFTQLGLTLSSEPPKVYPWGLKEFSVRDPDGHIIRFCDETFEVA